MPLRVAPPPAWARALRTCLIVAAGWISPFAGSRSERRREAALRALRFLRAARADVLVVLVCASSFRSLAFETLH